MTFDIAGSSASGIDLGALRIVELKLTDVPILTALKYICESTRLKYSMNRNAITIRPATDDGENIITRSIQVPPDFLDALSDSGMDESGTADPFASTPTAGSGLRPRANVQDLLKSKGIPFPEGASVNFIPSNSTLVIRNTPRIWT